MNVLSVEWMGKTLAGVGVKQYRIRCDCGRTFDVNVVLTDGAMREPIRCSGCGRREPLARMPRRGTSPLFDLD